MRRLRVGSWPGYEYKKNQFIKIFLDGLSQAGAEVISLDSVGKASSAKLDVLVVHWLDRFFWGAATQPVIIFRLLDFFRIIAQQKRRGVKIVWIVHNTRPHSLAQAKDGYWKIATWIFSRIVDGALTLSPNTISAVKEGFPALEQKPVSYFWHPKYDVDVPPNSHRLQSRLECGIPQGAFVFGYCGIIRNYKGIGGLLGAFRNLSMENAVLYLRGSLIKTSEEEITDLAEGDDRIHFDFRRLSVQDFNQALTDCDVIVAPQRSYLHSGSIVHALSAHRPVLTPRTPFAEGLAEVVGPGWVRLYDGELSAELLEKQTRMPVPSRPPNLEKLEKGEVGRQVLRFLEGLSGR